MTPRDNGRGRLREHLPPSVRFPAARGNHPLAAIIGDGRGLRWKLTSLAVPDSSTPFLAEILQREPRAFRQIEPKPPQFIFEFGGALLAVTTGPDVKRLVLWKFRQIRQLQTGQSQLPQCRQFCERRGAHRFARYSAEPVRIPGFRGVYPEISRWCQIAPAEVDPGYGLVPFELVLSQVLDRDPMWRTHGPQAHTGRPILDPRNALTDDSRLANCDQHEDADEHHKAARG